MHLYKPLYGRTGNLVVLPLGFQTLQSSPQNQYLPLDEYCRRTGTNKETARNLIEYGKLPIKPKGKQKKGLVEVNMAALTIQALSECDISLNA